MQGRAWPFSRNHRTSPELGGSGGEQPEAARHGGHGGDGGGSRREMAGAGPVREGRGPALPEEDGGGREGAWAFV